MLEITQQFSDEVAQETFGGLLSKYCETGLVIYLQGELGVGKTTFARGFVRGMGYDGPVKSPTYTLVEEYSPNEQHCYHFDLYRLADPEELDYLGMRDFVFDEDILLIEWPDKGEGWLPKADVVIALFYEGQGRRLQLEAKTEKGNYFLKQLPL